MADSRGDSSSDESSDEEFETSSRVSVAENRLGEELVIRDWVFKVEPRGHCRLYLRLLTRDYDTGGVLWYDDRGDNEEWVILEGDMEIPHPTRAEYAEVIEWLMEPSPSK